MAYAATRQRPSSFTRVSRSVMLLLRNEVVKSIIAYSPSGAPRRVVVRCTREAVRETRFDSFRAHQSIRDLAVWLVLKDSALRPRACADFARENGSCPIPHPPRHLCKTRRTAIVACILLTRLLIK